MEAWRDTFRRGLVPLLSNDELRALRDALATDDARLIQGANTLPPPMQVCATCPVEGACVICYGPWKGSGLETVEEVNESFGRLCYLMDGKMGEPAACRWLTGWYDEAPRAEVLRELLPEVELALASRDGGPHA